MIAPARRPTAEPARESLTPLKLHHHKPRAESREPRAESREPRAESREPRAESREPRAESREPRAESREPRAESREPRAESREPRAESREPRAESREPRAESREPRAESREPRAESREPRAESAFLFLLRFSPAGQACTVRGGDGRGGPGGAFCRRGPGAADSDAGRQQGAQRSLCCGHARGAIPRAGAAIHHRPERCGGVQADQGRPIFLGICGRGDIAICCRHP